MPDMVTLGIVEKKLSDPTAIENAVSDWLDDHPEATTTVQDGAVSYAKLDSSLKGSVDDVSELKSAITLDDLFINGYDIDLTASGNTDFSLKTGQKVILFVTGLKNGASVYTNNYSSDVYYTISARGKYEITARHDGQLRFYVGSGNRIRGKFYSESRFDGLKDPVPAFESVAIKKIKVFDNFTVNTGSFSFNMDATVSTYATYATSSSVAQNVPPIKVRNDDGSLIYKNLHLTATSNADVTALWSFDKFGYYLRTATVTQYRARQKPILDDEYYIIPNQYTTLPSNEWKVGNVDIEWLNSPKNQEYTVGSGGDYATLTAALTALADDDSEKTIYIKPGEYNIFTEMGGADYMAEISATASELNWRDVCPVVPPNTKIVGIGNVVLKWEATAAQMVNSATAFLFSPLNLSGSCEIENINVVAENCRYAVHDETSGLSDYNGAKHIFRNCSFTMLSGTYGGPAFGSGHNKLMEFVFDGCVFDSRNDVSIWSTHDWSTPLNESSSFTFNNCVFISTKTTPVVAFSSSDPYGRKDKVLFNNCYLNNIKFLNGDGAAKQGYEVTLIGCTPVEVLYASTVTDRYDTHQYNPIPQAES